MSRERGEWKVILTLYRVFFIPETGQPTGITNEPLSEWPMNEVLDYTPYPAEDDVYGKMSFYVRDLVAAFQNRLKKGGMFIKIMACGLVEMVGHIPKYQHKTPYFDRIEVMCKRNAKRRDFSQV